ncbi:MAG: M1 family metallopeptidase [Okeania sp. SIO3B3]|nr:M1 family metallopeptidase [Okeania sp. SIO3B3]
MNGALRRNITFKSSTVTFSIRLTHPTGLMNGALRRNITFKSSTVTFSIRLTHPTGIMSYQLSV